MDLRRGINSAVEKVLSYLKQHAKMISTTEEIAQVRRQSRRLLSIYSLITLVTSLQQRIGSFLHTVEVCKASVLSLNSHRAAGSPAGSKA